MIKLFLRSYSSLLFSTNTYLGLIIFLITFLNYSVAISGVIAIISSSLVIYFMQNKHKDLLKSFYIYNSLLIGMGIGYFYTISSFSILLIIILSICTLLLSLFLNNTIGRYGIPILSLPFTIISIFIYLLPLESFDIFTSIRNQTIPFDIYLPQVISSLFKSVGSIFFLPNNLAGFIILSALLFHSRIMFLISIIGFYFGVYIHSLLLDSWEQAFLYPYSFNYIITAIALYGIFLLPTIKNFVLTLFAIVMTALISYLMSTYLTYYAITLPFNIVVITLLLVLYFIKYKQLNYIMTNTPEESFSTYYSNLSRFSPQKIQISLPFSATWSVYQAFNGEWTHKNQWRHAYDFVITKEGKSYANQGNYLEDYYCYGESILSPVNGYIIESNDTLRDNLIGEIDKINNWGNFIIIQSLDGNFVEISHLMYQSLSVKEGDYVSINTPLAKCGNSGYSSQPHIHIQVQKFSMLGSPTLPFCFSEFIQDDKLIFQALPLLNKNIKNIIPQQYIAQKLTFTPNEEYLFDVYVKNIYVETFKIKVMTTIQGELYFTDIKNNKLFFYQTHSLFYFYNYIGTDSYLKKFFLLMPKIPLTNSYLTFTDYFPSDLLNDSQLKIVTQLYLTINPTKYMRAYHYTLENNTLKSTFGKVYLSTQNKGFDKLLYDNFELRINT